MFLCCHGRFVSVVRRRSYFMLWHWSLSFAGCDTGPVVRHYVVSVSLMVLEPGFPRTTMTYPFSSRAAMTLEWCRRRLNGTKRSRGSRLTVTSPVVRFFEGCCSSRTFSRIWSVVWIESSAREELVRGTDKGKNVGPRRRFSLKVFSVYIFPPHPLPNFGATFLQGLPGGNRALTFLLFVDEKTNLKSAERSLFSVRVIGD